MKRSSLLLASLLALPAALAGQAGGTLHGVVFDSTRNRPLAGARLLLDGRADSVRTDAEGRFSLARVAPGLHALAFAHPRLDSLRFVPGPAMVTLAAGQALRQDLAIPSTATMLAATCHPAAGRAVGAAVGRVTDRTVGQPLPAASITATWRVPETGAPARATVVTDEAGSYRFCELPEGVQVRLVARMEEDSAVTQVEPRRGAPQQRDLVLAVSAEVLAGRVNAERTRAHVVVRLVDAASGRPIEGARVSFSGAAPDRTSDRNGEFAVDLWSGSYAVAFDHPTYGPGTGRLSVAGRGTVQYELKIPRRTVALEPLAVVAERVLPGYFNPRSRGRHLDMITREEIERRLGAARDIGDLVRTFRNLTVSEVHYPGSSMIKEICVIDRTAIPAGALLVQNPGEGAYGSLAGRARPNQAPSLAGMGGTLCHGTAVAVDEVLIGGNVGEFLRSYPTTGIESIIYLKPTDATGRYGLAGQNGVILIYTRGNGPTVVREQQ